MARRKKKVKSTKKAPATAAAPQRPEVQAFTLEKDELLQLMYCEERVARLRSDMALTQNVLQQEAVTRDSVKEALASKYTENGKYVFVGAINKDTFSGERVLASEAELLNRFLAEEAAAAQLAAQEAAQAPAEEPEDSDDEDEDSDDEDEEDEEEEDSAADEDSKEERAAALRRELEALESE